jgi:hypothetical protein
MPASDFLEPEDEPLLDELLFPESLALTWL